MDTTKFGRTEALVAASPGALIKNKPMEYNKYSENKGKGMSVKKGEHPEVLEEEKVEFKQAERFDYTFNDCFYALNFEIDEYGERVTSKQDEEFSRIITKDGIHREEETFEEEEVFE